MPTARVYDFRGALAWLEARTHGCQTRLHQGRNAASSPVAEGQSGAEAKQTDRNRGANSQAFASARRPFRVGSRHPMTAGGVDRP